MVDKLEDRTNELTALESIYERSLVITQNTGLQKFEVRLSGHSDNNSTITVGCTIAFEYTDGYPEEAPVYTITRTEGLTPQDCVKLNELIDSVIQRSLGYIMIFDILSEVQEKLNSTCEQQMLQLVKAQEAKRHAAEMEEEAKFRGDRVTVESFVKWNTNFLAEMAALKENAIVDSGPKRLTGRELFLRDNRYDDSDLKFLSENGESVEIDECLFADIGELDLIDDLPVEEDVATAEA
ncbi:RWD domain-containing protein 1 [Paragonimus heterotremus]|uniref:RWD domain-containing protein 1 n=1 Tax=Paragonimus heterotremus TaxID=100268 RepID=A0A8J4WMR4_9TREM|nr:RWD domain-containing protein 1 [Paragonimus heterotremus]